MANVHQGKEHIVMHLEDIKDISERKKIYADYCQQFLKDEQMIKIMRHIILDMLDDRFFIDPSSSTGKHHPEWARGECGGIRHHINTGLMSLNLLPLFGLEKNEACEQDAIVISGFTHDGDKNTGPDGRWGEFTVPNHAKIFADRIAALAKLPIAQGREKAIKILKECIYWHMSRWGMPQAKMIYNLKPHEQILVFSDFVASRKASKGWDPRTNLQE